MRAALALAVIGVLGWLGGCSDSSGPVCCEPPLGLVVSDPVLRAGVASGVGGALALASSPADTFAYVSLPPGTVPTGSSAVMRRAGDAATITTAVLDGGFDPVPVGAQAGDSIEVVVKNAGGSTVAVFGIAVTARRPPIIVRTDPPRRRTDVTLNAAIVIVFSEPIAGGTLTPSSVRLLRETTAVPGTVHSLQGTGAAAAFTPTAPLAPNTAYQLVVTQAVQDLEGDPLETGVTVDFTTGASSTGPPASMMLSPDTVSVTAEATYQLTATVRDAAGNILIDQPVAWTTNDALGLSVSATGLLTAQAPGLYIVTATLNGLAAFARVIVTPGIPASVTISPSQSGVGAAGDTIILAATVHDARGRLIRYPSLTWTSSAPAMATVGSYGTVGSGLATVTGVNPGSATITATSGTASGTAFVTVNPPLPVASLTVAPASVTLLLRFTRQLSVTVRDPNGRILPGRPVGWTSDNAAAVTVDANGLVTAVGAGSAAVFATSEGVSDTAAVTSVVVHLGSITAGAFHTCALSTNGAAYCWGSNYAGQLGDGNEPFSPLVPVPVAGGLAFSMLSASSFHTCGLTTSGAAYCWGWNGSGQLGNGSTTDSSAPVAVTGGLTFSTVSAGQYHTCGLTTNGAAYCWGNNVSGQLGNGSTTNSSVPVAVTGGISFSTVSTGTGGGYACGLTPNGAAYCWGDNFSGQLGDGSTTSSSVPVALSGGLTFSAIATGRFHACGLTASGAYCWGANADGQLGDGTTTNRLAPVAVSGALAFMALAGGHYHTCGLTTGGEAYCWGSNEFGGLGDGTLTTRLAPIAVSGGFTFAEVPRGGYGHSCARTSTGTAYCWGYNDFAQLGDGSTNSSSVPVRVAGQP